MYVYVGGWGVCPTGKSISVSVAVPCVRACEAVCGREDDDSSRARPKY